MERELPELAEDLSGGRAFEQIRIMTVSIAGTVDPAVKNYAVSGVTVKQGGSFVTPAPGPAAGGPGQQPVAHARDSHAVPGDWPDQDHRPRGHAGGYGGGYLRQPAGSRRELPVDAGKPPTSFDQLLKALRNAPSSASVHLVLAIYGPTGTVSVNDAVAVDRAVAPSETGFPVEISDALKEVAA